MNRDKARERIAKKLFQESWAGSKWSNLSNEAKNSWRGKADQILNDPDILIKAENQDLPNPPRCPYSEREDTLAWYKQAQQDMLNDHWMKVEEA